MAKALKEELSFRAYARHRGVSHTAVEKAVKSKRLVRCLLKRGNRILIDPAIADREWSQATDPAFQRDREQQRSGGTIGAPPGTLPPNAGRPKQAGLYGADAEDAAAEAGELGSSEEPRGPSLSRMRAYEMALRAQMTKLDLEERTGQLVRASAVAAESFRVGREVRDALLRIPVRVTGALMAERDAHAFEQALTAEIIKALDALSNSAAQRNA